MLSDVSESCDIEENRPDVGGADNSAGDFSAATFHSQLTTPETAAKNALRELREATMVKKIKHLEEQQAKERKEKYKLKKENKNIERQFPVLGSKMSKVFNKDQLVSLSRSSNRGVKWSNETIKKGLKIRFACGSSGYDLLLQEHLPLPSLRSLRRSLECISMEPGVLEEVFQFLKLKVVQMRPEERECCLTLDEMCIQEGLQYDRSSSCLRGGVTLPGHDGVATHALVFMLGGIATRWKQTVAYYFTGNSVRGETLKPVVLEVISRANDIGLHVSTVTSDMGSMNRALLSSFGIICSRDCAVVNKIPHPHNENDFLYFMHDVPHIVKNLWASFVRGNDIILNDAVVEKCGLPSKEVSLEHIKKLLSFQADKDLKLAPKLTAATLNPSHFQKMKVSGALTFFSHSVSAGLRYLVECEGYGKELLTTAWFLDLINKWFDLMSSRHQKMALSKYNQVSYEQAIAHLETVTWVFQEISVGRKGRWKPIQTDVILSTTTILNLQSAYLAKGYKYLLTSRFTQDCLENLFSSIRIKNSVPTALEFRQALKLISVAQFLKCPDTSNYCADEGELLAEFLNVSTVDQNYDEEPHELDIVDSSRHMIGHSEESSLHYLVGYCIKKIKTSNIHCPSCLLAVEDKTSYGPQQKLTELKEYKENSLVYCSTNSMKLVMTAEKIFRATEDTFENSKKILDRLVQEAEKVTKEIELPTCHDIKNKLLKHYFTLRLHIHAHNQAKKIRTEARQAREKKELGSKSMMMRAAVNKYR